MMRIFVTIGALFGLAAVLLGAFGAHGLAAQVSPERLAVWETAAHYLGWHATTLLALAALAGGGSGGGRFAATGPRRLLAIAAGCFVAGGLLFSGSLFLLVWTDTPALGAVTPLGGLAFAIGWALVAVGLWRGLGAVAE